MVWKVVTVITNLRFTAYIAFHNVLTYRTLPPAWVNLKQITTEQVALYHQVPS